MLLENNYIDKFKNLNVIMINNQYRLLVIEIVIEVNFVNVIVIVIVI